jgi:hypothetical protein
MHITYVIRKIIEKKRSKSPTWGALDGRTRSLGATARRTGFALLILPARLTLLLLARDFSAAPMFHQNFKIFKYLLNEF